MPERSKEAPTSAADLLSEAADTFRERNAMYRSNWEDVGHILRSMFPEGITLTTACDHTRFHFIILMVVKLSRYANCWKTGHQDSLRDTAVYAAMLEFFDEHDIPKWDAKDEGVEEIRERYKGEYGTSSKDVGYLLRMIDQERQNQRK